MVVMEESNDLLPFFLVKLLIDGDLMRSFELSLDDLTRGGSSCSTEAVVS